MHFIIYQTINLINSKIYVGKHKTAKLDDGYLGSGKCLKAAIAKYGVESFERIILHECQTEEEMNLLEKEIVTEEFCNRTDTYNIGVGGLGGFSYINRHITPEQLRARAKNGQKATRRKFKADPESLQVIKHRISVASKLRYQALSIEDKKSSIIRMRSGLKTNPSLVQQSLQKRKDTFAKIEHNRGSKNSQFGTIWITNGVSNLKIKSSDAIPEGFRRGRTALNR